MVNNKGGPRKEPVMRRIADCEKVRWQFQVLRIAPSRIEQDPASSHGGDYDFEERALVEAYHAAESNINWRLASGEEVPQRSRTLPIP